MKTNWQEEFDERFVSHHYVQSIYIKECKQFIQNLLLQQEKQIRKKIEEEIEIAQKKWKKCERKNCNNKEECERANTYVETIWNPTFKELLNKIKKL